MSMRLKEQLRRLFRNPSAGFRSATQRLLRDKRGAVSMMVAAALPVMVGFTALGIDMSNVYYHRKKLQATANAAALAGSIQLNGLAGGRTLAVSTATSYATKNMPTSRYGTVLANADVQLGTWDVANRTFTVSASNLVTAVRVTVRSTAATSNPVQLFFSRIIGHSTMDMTAVATATFGTFKTWDISIVQDVTASLNSTQMANAKIADQSLFGCLKDNYASTSQASLISHTGISQVKIGMTSTGTNSNFTNLTNAITNMNICGNSGQPACSGTNMAAGLQAAIGHFTNYTPAATGTGTNGKAIILVSDGEPNWNNTSTTNNGLYGTSMGGNCTGCTNSTNGNAALAANAVAQANAAAAAGIVVHTIYLNQSGNAVGDPGQIFLDSLKRDAGGSTGLALTTTDSAQLSNLMFQICATVPRRLVE